jgi:hypothetical protein
MSEYKQRVVTNLKYSANREYDKRGGLNKRANVFVGWNPVLQSYVVCVAPDINGAAFVYLLGSSPNFMTKEQLIDYAFDATEKLNAVLTVYPEPRRF